MQLRWDIFCPCILLIRMNPYRSKISGIGECDQNCISIRKLGLYTVFEVSHAYMIYSFWMILISVLHPGFFCETPALEAFRKTKTTASAVVVLFQLFCLKRYFVHFFSSLEVHHFLAAFVSNAYQIDLLRKSA